MRLKTSLLSFELVEIKGLVLTLTTGFGTHFITHFLV